MPLTRERKEELVKEIEDLLNVSKLTVLATYEGISVKDMQTLRKQAKEKDTSVKVFKNRIFTKALTETDKYKVVDLSVFNSMLMYVYGTDEVASAQVIASFAKQHPSVKFIGALTETGEFLSAEDTQTLSSLPTLPELRSQLLSVLSAPLSGFVSVISANLTSVLYVLNARAEKI